MLMICGRITLMAHHMTIERSFFLLLIFSFNIYTEMVRSSPKIQLTNIWHFIWNIQNEFTIKCCKVQNSIVHKIQEKILLLTWYNWYGQHYKFSIAKMKIRVDPGRLGSKQKYDPTRRVGSYGSRVTKIN